MKKIKNIAIIGVFALIIFGLALTGLLTPDGALSYSERRKLAQAPTLSAASVLSGEYMEDLEDYLLDQFPARDSFRGVKAALRFYLFRQLDNNGVWLLGEQVFKTEYPLKEAQVLYGAELISSVTERYLGDSQVYCAVIPDKNYFAAASSGYPAIDYDRLVALLRENVEASYIDLFPSLSLSDYYRTDSHWRQDCILPVVQALAEGMGTAEYLTAESEYEAQSLYPFYGVFMGQSALPVEPDTLTYLTSADTESAVVTGVEFEGEEPVYVTERFTGMDGYDVFLNGAQALLTIDCPDARSDRELVIFRDSFGSSIAPLFTGAYSRITLIDLRYMNSALLEQYVDFAGADVLFLYSASVLNSAMLMK